MVDVSSYEENADTILEWINGNPTRLVCFETAIGMFNVKRMGKVLGLAERFATYAEPPEPVAEAPQGDPPRKGRPKGSKNKPKTGSTSRLSRASGPEVTARKD